MILDDFKFLEATKDFDPALSGYSRKAYQMNGRTIGEATAENIRNVRKGLLNKYKIEAVYYMVIEAMLHQYGMPAPGYDKDDPRFDKSTDSGKWEVARQKFLDGTDIANMDIGVLGCARDQMAMRMSDNNDVAYDSYDISKYFGSRMFPELNGVKITIADTKDIDLKAIAKAAILNSEAMWNLVQTRLASMDDSGNPAMSDDELYDETEKEFVKICEDDGPVMRRILGNIRNMEMHSETARNGGFRRNSATQASVENKNARRVPEDDYTMYVHDHDNTKNIWTLNRVKGLGGTEEDWNKFVATVVESESKNPSNNVTIERDVDGAVTRIACDYLEKAAYDGNLNRAETKDQLSLFLRISPLMPEAECLRQLGVFKDVIKKNGFFVFDQDRNALVSLHADSHKQDESIAVGWPDYVEKRHTNYYARNWGKGDAFEPVIDSSDPLISDPHRKEHVLDIQAGLSTCFKLRMVSILEKYSQQPLNESDIEIIESMCTSDMFGPLTEHDDVTFKQSYDEIMKNADAYFEYIEHVCSVTKQKMASHEFEIHFRNMSNRGVLPAMYMTGERTTDYYTAKSGMPRYVEVYPYANYKANNINVATFMGDVSIGSRDNFRITNMDMRGNTDPKNNLYLTGGPIDTMVVDNMRATFDAYMLPKTADEIAAEERAIRNRRREDDRSDIRISKISRAVVDNNGNIRAKDGNNADSDDKGDAGYTRDLAGMYDAANFINANGVIDSERIIRCLVDDMNAVKEDQSKYFKMEANEGRFHAILDDYKDDIDFETAIFDEYLAKAGANGYINPDDENELKNTVVSQLVNNMNVVIRDALSTDMNNYTVARHLFTKYISLYADMCFDRLRDVFSREGFGENVKRKLFTDMIRGGDGDKPLVEELFDDDEILDEGLSEIFGYEKDGMVVLKANMCKYMPKNIAYDDYDKLLTLLSNTNNAEYEPDVLADAFEKHKDTDLNNKNRKSNLVVQLYSFEAYNGRKNDTTSNISGTQEETNEDDIERYDTSFENEAWYTSTFVKPSDKDKSLAAILNNDDESAIYRATHPLCMAVMEKIRKMTNWSGDDIKITPEGVVYVEKKNAQGENIGFEFKIGPVLDEKAYIKPYVEYMNVNENDTDAPVRKIERDSDDQPVDKWAIRVEGTLRDYRRDRENGNVVYDDSGAVVTRPMWAVVENKPVVKDGKLLNEIAWGALDTDRVMPGKTSNRFYGVSSQIDNYDGYDHKNQSYSDRARFKTYATSVLNSVEQAIALKRIADNTITPYDGDDELKKDAQDSQKSERIKAYATAYTEINGNALMKCYKTKTYILGDKVACQKANAFLSTYMPAMGKAQENLSDLMSGPEWESIGQDERLRTFYEALAASDMDRLDEIACDDEMLAAINGSSDAKERFESYNKMYGGLIEDDAKDVVIRKKYRENANNILMQAEMNHKRVIFPKITLDQNIGLYIEVVNIQHARKDMVVGDVDRKAQRNTDSKNGRVAVFEDNPLFDQAISATAKQLGAVGYLVDQVELDKLTGEVVFTASHVVIDSKTGKTIGEDDPKNRTEIRCRIASTGVGDFVTGGQEHEIVKYQDAKALDREQLSINAELKGLGYSDVTMAMINLGYNMEDGYIISKDIAKKLGHFGKDGRWHSAGVDDKIGDSEAGNKGVIAKVVDTDIETEDELKLKLIRGYINERKANGEIRKVNTDGIVSYRDPSLEAWPSANAKFEAVYEHEREIDIMYAGAYDELREALGEDNEGNENSLLLAEFQTMTQKHSNMDVTAKAIFMKQFMESTEKRKKEIGNDAVFNEIINNVTRQNKIRKPFVDFIAGLEKSRDESLKTYADEMFDNNIKPWTERYTHERTLWKLFKDNPDLDVAVTNVCVNTRSNPALLMYIADSEDNTLKIDGKEYPGAKGKIKLYVDSHTEEDKNIDYVDTPMKSGRGAGSQELYAMDAKHAVDYVTKLFMAQDKTMAENIMRFNRKLMMNGFAFDMSPKPDGVDMKMTTVGDMINNVGELTPSENIFAYSSEQIPGSAFIDMDRLTDDMFRAITNQGHKSNEQVNLVNAIGDYLNFAPAMTNSDIDNKGDMPNTMDTEDKLRKLFVTAFGKYGGNFMLLPEGMDVEPKVWHKDSKKPENSNNGNNGREEEMPESRDSFESYDDIESEDDFDDGYDPNRYDDFLDYQDDDNDRNKGKFPVDMYGDVSVNGATRRAAPLFITAYEKIDTDTGSKTAKIDDKVQFEIFKCTIGYSLVKKIKEREGENDSKVKNACENAMKTIEKRMERCYSGITNPRNKALSISDLSYELKKKMYRITFPKSATCVWSGDPNIAPDEAGISFDQAKKLGLLEPKKPSAEEKGRLESIPDDYEHMLERYEPLDDTSYVWVNRSPGQTTGCVRMFRARIVCEHGRGLKINPACATIFDGDFDGDTVGLVNPFPQPSGKMSNEEKTYLNALKRKALVEMNRTMTMSANMIKTADYDKVEYVKNGKSVTIDNVNPLFIAGNADIAIAKYNMKNSGDANVVDIDKRLERVTVAANVLEQVKQMYIDGHNGTMELEEGNKPGITKIRSARADQIERLMGYIDADYENVRNDGAMRRVYDEVRALVGYGQTDKNTGMEVGAKKFLMAACRTRDKNGNVESALNVISLVERRNMDVLKDAYKSMTKYMSNPPCFTHGGNVLEMLCNKVEEANISKKGKAPQLNALLLYSGVHKDCADGDYKTYLDVCKDGNDFRVRVTDFEYKGEAVSGILKNDEEGRLAIYSNGTKMKDSDDIVKAIGEEVKFDNTRAKTDVPKSKFRTESELNIAAQSDKSDATGMGGSVAQKLQIIFSLYGCSELALRISGPITQKFLDAKQNVTKCETNLKIGKAVLTAVCKFQYVEELGPKYAQYAKLKHEPDVSMLYKGRFNVDRNRCTTIGDGITQIDNLLAMMELPRLTEIDKATMAVCINDICDKYEKATGKKRDERYGEGLNRIIPADLATMCSKIGNTPYDLMYNTPENMAGRKFQDLADAHKSIFDNSVYSDNLPMDAIAEYMDAAFDDRDLGERITESARNLVKESVKDAFRKKQADKATAKALGLDAQDDDKHEKRIVDINNDDDDDDDEDEDDDIHGTPGE